jgi:hypothetical protein
VNKIAIFLVCIFAASSVFAAATVPTMPQVWVETTYSLPTGTTTAVNSGGNLQTAIDNAALNDVIVVEAGTTWAGISLPNKATGSGWIYIVSSAYASLPAQGVRVAPTDASNMFKLTPSAAGSNTALSTANGAHHYRLIGVEIAPRSGEFNTTLIAMGGAATSSSNLPNNIVFDRCYIHGDATVGSRRGINLDGTSVAVIDSYLSDFKEDGADTQAIWINNTNGPIKVVNNYIEAAGECMMFGGSSIPIANAVPSDVEIRKNTFSKNTDWIGSAWDVKNLLESKNSRRVLVEGNIFQNTWAAMQEGYSILIKPVNQENNTAWVRAEDWTIRYNEFKTNVGAGISLVGVSDQPGDNVGQRFLIQDNIIAVASVNGSVGYAIQLLDQRDDVTIKHNTIIPVWGIQVGGTVGGEIDFIDNMISSGTYGLKGDGTATGTATLTHFFTAYSFTSNAVIAGTELAYGSGNYFPANAAAVEFTDYDNRIFSLASGSDFKAGGVSDASDGKDMGADFAAITAAMAYGHNHYIRSSITIGAGSHSIAIGAGSGSITISP